MISDVLSESVTDIRDYLKTFPKVYKGMNRRIKKLLKEMESIRIELDTIPSKKEK